MGHDKGAHPCGEQNAQSRQATPPRYRSVPARPLASSLDRWGIIDKRLKSKLGHSGFPRNTSRCPPSDPDGRQSGDFWLFQHARWGWRRAGIVETAGNRDHRRLTAPPRSP